MSWQELNGQYLAAALDRVRAALTRALKRDAPAQSAVDMALRAAEALLPAPSALEQVCTSFGLSEFERDLLLLCAGPELDPGFARLCAEVQGDPRTAYPTFGLALACLPGAHWNALLPASPLRYWHLIEVGPGDALNRSPLRIDERVLHFLAGSQYLDQRLEGVLQSMNVGPDLPRSQSEVVERVVALWSGGTGSFPVIALHGRDPKVLSAVAAKTTSRLGLGLYVLKVADMPDGTADIQTLSRLCEREAVLSGCGLLLDVDDAEAILRRVGAFTARLTAPLFVASRQPFTLQAGRPVVRFAVERPTTNEQQETWRRVLGTRAASLNGHIAALSAQYTLTVTMIESAAAEVLAGLPAIASSDEIKQRLWDVCRSQARPQLDDLALRIATRAGWNDLVLPESQLNMLREIEAQVRQRNTVYETWGFAERSSRGLGTSVVFAGASGTGKTLAAEVLANELRLDLYRIDLSSVVSKYIGETEKNLRRIFDAAEYGGAILLFDEADALFGKRSEVKDSHDRYANIEVSFLLQQMEAYRGLAILTTNMLSAFDPAFLRRVRFIVQFPFPSAESRAEIWARVFPSKTPTHGLDLRKLARLNLTGGNIYNIALNAAFLAADAAEPVQMGHVLRAAQSEYVKLDRPLGAADVQDWA